MKKLIYVILFTLLGVLLGFLTSTLFSFAVAIALVKSYDRFGFGLVFWQWEKLFYFLYVSLMAIGFMFGVWQGVMWWKIIYVQGRRFGKKTKAIILDFDHAIFNTTLYVQALRKKFKQDFDIDEQVFTDIRNQVKKCCTVVDIDEFVRRLPSKNKKAMHDAHEQLLEANIGKFVFPDAYDFISHHKGSFDIILLTHGNKELQHEKIKNSKLPKNLEVIVSLKNKSQVIGRLTDRYKQIHFIDDKVSSIEEVKTTWPEVNTYLIRRPLDHLDGDKDFSCDYADHIVSGLNFEIED